MVIVKIIQKLIGQGFKSTPTERLTGVEFQKIFDSMIEGCQIIDRQWRYVYLNESAAQQGQHRPNELIGHTMMEMYPGIEKTELFNQLKRCLEEGKPYQMENEFILPDGTKSWFELRIQPLPEGLLILSFDITDRKKSQAQVNQRNQELEKTISLMVGRELKMATMKKELKKLKLDKSNGQ